MPQWTFFSAFKPVEQIIYLFQGTRVGVSGYTMQLSNIVKAGNVRSIGYSPLRLQFTYTQKENKVEFV